MLSFSQYVATHSPQSNILSEFTLRSVGKVAAAGYTYAQFRNAVAAANRIKNSNNLSLEDKVELLAQSLIYLARQNLGHAGLSYISAKK